MKRIIPKILIVVLLVCMACSVTAVAVAQTEEVTETNKVNLMHLTDTHYIPIELCYTGDKEDNAFANKMHGDPKLMLESYAVLIESLNMVKEANPDYLLLTGDITSNGERQALVDTANALRKLQNELRAAGNTNFQVFAIPGNHDVFNNRHASDYSSGEKVPAAIASREEFVKIFASLGYPDITDEEAKAFYNDKEWSAKGKFLPYENDGETAFVNSTTREGLKFEYFADEVKDANGKSLLDAPGGLTYLAYDDENKMSFVGFDSNLSEKDNQRTDGDYNVKTLDWYLSKNLEGYTQISMAHHNIIPHYTKQEQYTPMFVTYGWEEVAEKLATKGVRYSYTGHFHANDMNTYVSLQNNNLMYELETAATISYGSAVRETAIVDYSNGSQDFKSFLKPVEKADFSYLVENNIMPKGYENCLDKNNIVDLQKYINLRLFKPYLYNMLDNLISPAKLYPKLDNIELMGINLSPAVKKLLGEINTKVLKDYEYKGDNVKLSGEENKAIAYLSDIVFKMAKTPVAIGKDLNDLIIFSYGSHLMGSEPENESDLPIWVKDAYKKFRRGEGLEEAIGDAIYDEGGIYELVEKLANTTIDLSDVGLEGLITMVGAKDVDLKNLTLNVDAPKIIAAAKKTLGKLGMSVAALDMFKSDRLMDDLDPLLKAYLNEATYKGVGRVLVDISSSFSTDPTFDGEFNKEITYKYNKKDQYSFNKDGKVVEEPTRENGRLPSQVTVTNGTYSNYNRNFVWFTSKFLPQGDLQYKIVDSNEWITVPATTQIVPYADTLFDMGFFVSVTHKNIARHSVRLGPLEADSEYYYRVGDSSRDVWSPVYKFKTAGTDTDFSATIVSDIQAMERMTYKEIGKKLKQTASIYDNKMPELFISLGDLVNDAKSSNQWEYLLDDLCSYMANVTQVVVPGIQESKIYKPEAFDSATNVKLDMNMMYDYLDFHYDLNKERFNQGNRLFYSLDYSKVHFVVLDTNRVDKDKLSKDQVEWLKKDLAETEQPYKVVLMHKGIFSPGEHANDKLIVNMRKELAPIFYENKVNIVFQGYEHIYAETKLLDGEGKEAEDGVLYVTVGTMGPFKKEFVENTDIPLAIGADLNSPYLDSPTFGKLSFDGDKLSYQGYIFKDFYYVKVQEYPIYKLMWVWISLAVVGTIAIAGTLTAVILIQKNKKKAAAVAVSSENESNNEEVVDNIAFEENTSVDSVNEEVTDEVKEEETSSPEEELPQEEKEAENQDKE